MRVEHITREWYKFDELSGESKERALEELAYINVDNEWWDCTQDDAREIGLNITSFELDRYQHITGELLDSIANICEAILANHGESCGTYKIAKKFRHRTGEDNEELFLKELLNEYLSILNNEYEYLTSEESIVETIESNEYEFSIDGRM